MGRMALEFVFARILIIVVIHEPAIFEHTLVLLASPAKLRLNRVCVEPQRRGIDIDELGLVDVARRLRIDRPQHVGWPFRHVSQAC